ncbi:hypothetical protein B0A69_09720 [Chryseobacterium shigense]|uniref:Uncharacterized protein n=1 Tax=Chryseobacterium shigense TaxID=297244 RepID=A0A1N7IGL2_9FLAO|nr:hypothetical protein [Chryseobacterium shigense]PQA94717.1 hypothetical protein B0A69_09720 [Chryseobacterium shigense]SIS36227.1 hypothetical protein SAMN05421639_103734 [Chryseobacterium shigense]
MKLIENIEPIKITPDLVKSSLYIIFLITVLSYFIFFDKNLKIEYKETCPCNTEYTLSQYDEREKIWENRKYATDPDLKTFKLKNKMGFTIDKLENIDFYKLNDTLFRPSEKSAFDFFSKRFYWDCKNKEVWISTHYKLSFK